MTIKSGSRLGPYVREVVLSEDGRAHAYTFRRMLSHLFLVEESK